MLNAAIAKFNRALKHSDGSDNVRPGGPGFVGEVVETAEYGLASAAYGYVGVKHRDKKVLGMDLPLAAGVIGHAAQLGIAMFMPGSRALSHHVGVAARAGVGAWAHAVGASMAAKGQKRLLLPPGADVAAAQKAIPGSTVLGGLPQAPSESDYLTRDQLRALANR